MSQILTLAHVPDELDGDWLQHLRDFDAKHPGCHFQVIVDTKEVKQTLDEYEARLREIVPPLEFFTRIQK